MTSETDLFEALHRHQRDLGVPTLPLRLRRASQALNRAADTVLRRRSGISFARFTILGTLDATPGITGQQLAELTWQRAQSLADAAAALEEDGLIERRPGRGRERLHFLTDRGRAVLAPARRALEEINERAVADLEAEELEAFERTLTRIIAAVEG